MIDKIMINYMNYKDSHKKEIIIYATVEYFWILPTVTSYP